MLFNVTTSKIIIYIVARAMDFMTISYNTMYGT